MRKTLRNVFAMYTAWGQIVLALALVGLASSSAMAFFFGWSVSLMHGIFLVVVSIGFALGPHIAHKIWNEGRRVSAVAVAVLLLPLGFVEWYSHTGYTAGLRGVNIGDAKVQQAKYRGAQKAVSQDETNLELWRKQLADLVAAHAWAPTVTASGLRDQIPALDEAIRQETKRGGCGPKCLALQREKAAIGEKIGIAELRADLTTRIEATRKVLDKAQQKADTTEFKHSAAGEQATSISKLLALISTGSLSPTDMQAEVADQGANVGMSIAAMLQPALFFFAAGFFMVGAGSSRERLEAFLDNVNRHTRHLGQPEFKAAA